MTDNALLRGFVEALTVGDCRKFAREHAIEISSDVRYETGYAEEVCTVAAELLNRIAEEA
jgi:hypothetical protein